MMLNLQYDSRIAATLVIAGGLGFFGMACSTPESGDVPERRSEASAGDEARAVETSDDRTSSGGAATAEEIADILLNGARPFDGIVTSGQPSKETFRRLEEAGIETVVNLRTAAEMNWPEKALAREMGLNYGQIPIGGADDLTRENVDRFSTALQNSGRPALVHCASSNRVGAMFALRSHWRRDKSPETALEIGRRAGLDSLEDAVRSKIAGESP